MPISKLILWLFLQPIISFPALPLLILPQVVGDGDTSGNDNKNKSTKVDSVALDITGSTGNGVS